MGLGGFIGLRVFRVCRGPAPPNYPLTRMVGYISPYEKGSWGAWGGGGGGVGVGGIWFRGWFWVFLGGFGGVLGVNDHGGSMFICVHE